MAGIASTSATVDARVARVTAKRGRWPLLLAWTMTSLVTMVPLA
jgi:hypothetical protein